jgi:hypothetical protein
VDLVAWHVFVLVGEWFDYPGLPRNVAAGGTARLQRGSLVDGRVCLGDTGDTKQAIELQAWVPVLSWDEGARGG